MKKFNKVLIGDWESSGLIDWNKPINFEEGPQGLQVGLCVVEDPYGAWEIVDEFEATVGWLGPVPGQPQRQVEYPGLTWSAQAQHVHGLSVSSVLDKPHPMMICSYLEPFLKTHFGSEKIVFGGHNPSFDMYFNRQLLHMGEKINTIRFDHRTLDSNTLGFFLLGAHNSDELFRAVCGVDRGKHGALEDARLTVKSFKALSDEVRRVFPFE